MNSFEIVRWIFLKIFFSYYGNLYILILKIRKLKSVGGSIDSQLRKDPRRVGGKGGEGRGSIDS